MDSPTRLSDWPSVEVRVDCTLCSRRGCYRLARLAARYGAEMELGRLLAILARDCPCWRNGDPRADEARCGARFPDWDRRPAPGLERPTDFASRYQAMGPTRALTIADLQGPTVTVVCAPCRRRGVLRVAGLLRRFGPDLPLPTLLCRLADCAGLREPTPRCSACFDGPPTGRR